MMKISPRRPNQLLRGSLTGRSAQVQAECGIQLTPDASQGCGNVRGRVDKADLPFIGSTAWLCDGSSDAKFLRERQVYELGWRGDTKSRLAGTV